MAQVVRIGLIGSGFVSNFYMQGLKDVAGHEVKVVASPNAERCEAFAKRWGIPEWTTDVDGTIKRGDLDLIILGVPNFVHAELAIKCAQAGKKCRLHQNLWLATSKKPNKCWTP
jgi:myo-inositol 2-dehydrogenase / D-chiro-inositol 1-dehydrogenase